MGMMSTYNQIAQKNVPDGVIRGQNGKAMSKQRKVLGQTRSVPKDPWLNLEALSGLLESAHLIFEAGFTGCYVCKMAANGCKMAASLQIGCWLQVC